MFSSTKTLQVEIQVEVPIEKVGEYFESPARLVRVNPNFRSMDAPKISEDNRKAEWKAIDEVFVMGMTKEIHSTQIFTYVQPGKELTLETIPDSSYGLNVIMNLSFESKGEKSTLIQKHLTLKGSKLIMPFAYSKSESSQPEALKFMKERIESWYKDGNQIQ
eukprot:TRINITY_DN1053_c0_g1_i1.p2 TRINITY_DN1053_c0_g1~~TRINITY_DN1053_c0_g1_i1.p2  ORF type:complete len:162 (-),score=45.78 TRINITY_DN1053_c0_g1_i1:687-1172(-)